MNQYAYWVPCFPHGVMYPHYPEQGYYMQPSLQQYCQEEEAEAIAQLEYQVLEVEDTLRACSRGRSRAARRHLAQRTQQEMLTLREASRKEADLLRNELENSRKEAELLRNELETSRKEMAQEEKLHNELARKEAELLHNELETSRKEAKLLHNELETSRKEAELLHNELENSRKEAEQVQELNQELRDKLQKSRKEVELIDQELRDKLQKSRKEVELIDQELKALRSRDEARKEVRESDEAALLRASLQTSQELRVELDTLKESSSEAMRLCQVYTAENEILRQLCRQQHRKVEERRCETEEMQRAHVAESAKNVKKLVAMTQLCRRLRLQLEGQEAPVASAEA